MKSPIAHEIERLEAENRRLLDENARLKSLLERGVDEGTVPCPYCQGSGTVRKIKSIVLPDVNVLVVWGEAVVDFPPVKLDNGNGEWLTGRIVNTWGAMPVDVPPPITSSKVEPPFDDEERRKTLEAMGYGYRGGVIYNPVGVPCGVYQMPKAELTPPPPDVVVEWDSLTEDFYNSVTQPVFFAELANEYVAHERRNVLNIVLPALDFIIERGDCDEAITVGP